MTSDDVEAAASLPAALVEGPVLGVAVKAESTMEVERPTDRGVQPAGEPAALVRKQPRCLVLDCGSVTNRDANMKGAIRHHLPVEICEEVAVVVKEEWNLMKVQPHSTQDEFWRLVLEKTAMEPRLVEPVQAEITATLRQTFPETLEVMRKALACGVVLGMISNHVSWWFKHCAESAHLNELIPQELLVVSDEVSVSKPDAGIYEVFVKRLAEMHPGLQASDCIFVDDKDENVTAAEAVGFHGVVFDAKTSEPGELERRLASLGMVLK